jgi:hypothetical protein
MQVNKALIRPALTPGAPPLIESPNPGQPAMALRRRLPQSLAASRPAILFYKGLLQFRLRSIPRFRVAGRCSSIPTKLVGYQSIPFTTRNTRRNMVFRGLF